MTRHNVELSYTNGRRQILLDGQPVKGVRNVTVTVPYNDLPTVHIELIPNTLTYTGVANVIETHADPRTLPDIHDEND